MNLQKALNTATSSGQALVPEDLAPAIIEYLGKYTPLWSMIGKEQADGRTHEFVTRTAVPAAWVEGEATPANPKSSTYVRNSVQLKILRTWGSVTGFQQRMSERFVNALEAEIRGSVEGLADLVENQVLWGNDVDSYQFSGIDTYVTENAPGNIFDLNAVVTLTDLDNMIDAAQSYRGAGRDRYLFVASPQMISKITGLQTKIQRTVQTVEFEGGFRMETYRGIPLMPSSFVRPASTTTSPDVTATAAAGGSLPDNTYYYRIASVTMYGEQLVGGEGSATTATTNNSVSLSWTADQNAILYKVYRGTTAGADNLQLLTVIAARTYDGNGTVNGYVSSFTDDGSYTPVSQVVPLSAGEECLFLVNLDEDRGATLVGNLSPLGDRIDDFVVYTPLAVTKSTFDYMIEMFTALKVPYPSVHAIARRARVSA